MSTIPLSTTKAAEIAGVSPSTVVRWCRSGRFNCGKTAFGDWAIDADSFQSFLANKPQESKPSPTPWRNTMTIVPDTTPKKPRLTLAEMAALHKAGKLGVIELPMGATELPPKNT
jgi:hypothetical protein